MRNGPNYIPYISLGKMEKTDDFTHLVLESAELVALLFDGPFLLADVLVQGVDVGLQFVQPGLELLVVVLQVLDELLVLLVDGVGVHGEAGRCC